MKLTKSKLKQIIKEELREAAKTAGDSDRAYQNWVKGKTSQPAKFTPGVSRTDDDPAGTHRKYVPGTETHREKHARETGAAIQKPRFPNIGDYLKQSAWCKTDEQCAEVAQNFLLGDMKVYTERFVKELQQALKQG